MSIDQSAKDDEPASGEPAALKVLIAGPHPPPNGGIATVVRNLLALRFEAPIEMALFDRRKVPRPTNFAFRSLHSLTALMGAFGYWGIRNFWLLAAFRRALAEHRPDIVHIHPAAGHSFWTSCLLANAARRRGARAILHFHASSMDTFYGELGFFNRWLFGRFLAAPNHYIALSQSWRRWYSQFIPESRLDVVPNAIHWKSLQGVRSNAASRPPRVLFIGMMFAERKGVWDLIAAVPKVLDEFPRAEFILAGSDDEGVEARLSSDETTRKALHFVGDLDREGVLAAYHESDMMVLPAYREGMPMVMLEAMASGLPVVCSRVNAIPEVVQDGVNGILIEPGDSDALAERIITLLRDEALRERLGEAARLFIRDHHDVAGQADLLQDIYHRTMREAL